jgi:hypothetical protein
VLVSLEFKIANQAHAFAQRFGGRSDAVASELPPATPNAEVSTSGVIG